ncbi:MAG: Phosphatidylserine decarboxylase proenzyme [Alphaproteobacteria bacterium MarineAlpha5_Bin9]|nr:MAG: Phosphatidylserine decarboxylase proenzyme [Alphaproteobacteria bacterium MarineAlpha5_Bin9]|tara:strand:+ start:31441 stop:32118 length:678 start_codon:yes stop_codon:yes gene_type:complete
MNKINFKIHKAGWVYLIFFGILSILFYPFFTLISVFFLIITIFTIVFFRDPVRVIPKEDFVISPADGLITYIGKTKAPKELKLDDEFLKISIFLNVFNVHVNRLPVDGKISKVIYIPGKFFNASLDKASIHNEKNIILIENNKSEKIIVTQIAGLIARRIICDLTEEQNVKKGNKFGIIQFGSRVDLYLPLHYSPLVSIGQTVLGGETIISNPRMIKKIENSILI